MRTFIHKLVYVGTDHETMSLSPSISITSARALAWYSGCAARLYRIHEIAVHTDQHTCTSAVCSEHRNTIM